MAFTQTSFQIKAVRSARRGVQVSVGEWLHLEVHLRPTELAPKRTPASLNLGIVYREKAVFPAFGD